MNTVVGGPTAVGPHPGEVKQGESKARTWVEKLGISLLPLQLGPKANFSVKCWETQLFLNQKMLAK